MARAKIRTEDLIDAQVTLAKQANMATGSLVYRKTAGTGVPEVQTLATLKTDLVVRALSILSIAANTTAAAAANTDYIYKCTAGLVFTLPTAVGNTNLYTLKATTTGVSFATTSAQTVDGSTTGTLVTNQSLTFVSDNANWNIV